MKVFSIKCDSCGAVNRINRTQCLYCGQPLAIPGKGAILQSSLPGYGSERKVLKQRYELVRIVGEGGMGTVYEARDLQLGKRSVAIKEMSQKGLTPLERMVAAKNFQREALFLATLQHPHLPDIYDHFEENQHCYLVMSFIKGQTLEEYASIRNGILPMAEVLQIGLVLCDVLAYLHNHRPPIIFRDLKPSNIMRTAEGHIYLVDFGIARFFKPEQFKDTAHRGSSGYAPPEQYGKAQTTPRSDIYSLGATLYQLLSGYDLAKTPFHFPPIRELAPATPPQLAKVITSMLDLNEIRRPQNADSVKQILQDISTNTNMQPIQEPVRETWQKKSLTLAVFTVVVTLLVVLASSLFVVWRLGMKTSSTPTTTPTTRTAQTLTSDPTTTVKQFCNALNNLYPDWPNAYQQLSSVYQNTHSLDNFEENFQGTSTCSILSNPNAHRQAQIQLTMDCPPPGSPGGPPPLNGTPPPGGPPQEVNKATLTLIDDGSNGWKINEIDLVRQSCSMPPSSSPPSNVSF
jgi:serine/threonine protein kinase